MIIGIDGGGLDGSLGIARSDDMRTVMNVEDFVRFPQANANEHPVLRSSATMVDGGEGRSISYIFSDESVARDGHTIASNGWELGDFRNNPVFLWCHDQSSPPIGRVTSIAVSGKQLVGTVEYASREQYEFADVIFQLTKGGYLNAVSVSWLPLEWKFSTDKNRARGAVDFKRQTLLEISSVPVPALPTALATARAAGIDTGPLYAWAEKVLDGGGMIVIPRSDLEKLRKEAKMPTRTAVPVVPVAPEVATVVPAVVAPVPEPEGTSRTTAVAGKKVGKRGLYEVAHLAMILCDLGYLESMVDWEAAMEDDGSPVPAQLTQAIQLLGETLKAMTIEEVNEMLAEEVEEGSPTSDVIYSDAFAAKQASFRLFRSLASVHSSGLMPVMRELQAGKAVTIQVGEAKVEMGIAIVRAGKALSSRNEKSLRDAHGAITSACEMIAGVLDAAAKDETADEARALDTNSAEPAEKARAIRQRRANAMKHRTKLV